MRLIAEAGVTKSQRCGLRDYSKIKVVNGDSRCRDVGVVEDEIAVRVAY